MNIASISISGEITLNLHSLNNEGGEGNQIITRQLTIIDKEGKQHTVNGISGDMFKHIHVGHLINYSKEKKINLCENCIVGNPNRLSSGDDLKEKFKGNSDYNNEDVIDAVLELCVVDDTHGVLITKIGGKNTNVPRKSCVEYGWTIGIPRKNKTNSYIHTKLVPNAGGNEDSGSNEGQNIFHRPANHGAYAFICSIDAYRIGYNDMTRQYPIKYEIRQKRYKAVIQSLISSIINPRGAMTSTQKPHITDFKGVVTYTTSLVPAPTISAINEDYRDELEKITKTINKLENGTIHAEKFDSISALTEILVKLASASPYKIA